MQALCDASRQKGAGYEVCRVISNRPDAAGLDWAARQGFATASIDHKAYENKAAFEAVLQQELISAGADIICLAGFMRLLSGAFVEQWLGRLLNIHPSLLPSFPGLVPQQKALDAGVRLSGCTVHFVSEETDAGAIVMQSAVPVLPQDDEDVLSARILQAEHATYHRALSAVCLGNISWSGGQTAIIAPDYSAALHDFIND